MALFIIEFTRQLYAAKLEKQMHCHIEDGVYRTH
mgnify:FL=1